MKLEFVLCKDLPLPQQVPAAEEGVDATQQDAYSFPDSLPSKAANNFKVPFCFSFEKKKGTFHMTSDLPPIYNR